MTLLQAAVIGLLALIITPGYLFYFDVTPKVVVLLVGAGLALPGCAAAGSILRRFAGKNYQLFSLLLGLNVVVLGVATALSGNPALSAFGTNWRRFGSVIQAAILLFAWLVASHAAGRRDRAIALLRSIMVAGGISALYGIAQYFGWDPFLPAAGYHIGEGVWTIVRPPGTFGYVSYFATWLLFVSFLSMALAAMEGHSLWRRVSYLVAVLSTVAMLMTGTRAAVLGLAVGAAVWYFCKRKGEGPSLLPDSRVLLRVAGAAVVLSTLAVGFYFSPLGGKLRSRARWFVEDPWGGNRPALWRDTLRMASSRLWIGYGPEVFTAAFPRFESKALAESYPDFLHESPHNIFLDALVSQGIPGFLILAGLCVVGLRIRQQPWISAALAAGIVSQQFTVFTVPAAFIFYLTIALNVALDSPAPEVRRDWRLALAVSPVALALLYLAARFTLSDHALAMAQRRLEAADLPDAVAQYEQYQRRSLPGTSADLWYSRALLGVAQRTPDFRMRFYAVAQSGAAAQRATRLAEDPFNAWYNMATLYATQNDAQHTESSLRAAVAGSPYWFKPHWTLAQLFRLEHRWEEAESEAALAVELDAGKHPEVARTLAEIRAQKAADSAKH